VLSGSEPTLQGAQDKSGQTLAFFSDDKKQLKLIFFKTYPSAKKQKNYCVLALHTIVAVNKNLQLVQPSVRR
jgi:CRISPR/Cas system CMR subunit Cmr6 (Cas7 group RAMP superfamily)